MASKKKGAAVTTPAARGKKAKGLRRFEVQVPGGLGGRNAKQWVRLDVVEAVDERDAALKAGLKYDPPGYETRNRAPAKLVEVPNDRKT